MVMLGYIRVMDAIVSHTETHGSIIMHCNTYAINHIQIDTVDDDN